MPRKRPPPHEPPRIRVRRRGLAPGIIRPVAMGLLDLIRKNRAELAEAIGRGRYVDFSAANASRFRATRAAIAAHARGRVLDAGCGHMPFRPLALEHGHSYEGLDIEPRVPGVDHVGSVEDLTRFPDGSFDTILCLEVLEHLPDPEAAVKEMARSLSPGGRLIVSVPHLSRLHEEPHDYYRFTKYGLRRLLDVADLEPVELVRHGGILSFLGHQLSTLLVTLAWPVPGLRRVCYELNRIAFVHPLIWMDRLLDPGGILPLGYVAVARRRGG